MRISWRFGLSTSSTAATVATAVFGPHRSLRANFSVPPQQRTRGTVAADISLAVIHKRAKRPGTARRSELVNNCAAGENFAGERPAPAPSQSQSPHPKRVIGRLLAEPEALAPTSHRKRPQEGHYITAMDV